jgi:hypothetical protein
MGKNGTLVTDRPPLALYDDDAEYELGRSESRPVHRKG